MSLCELSLARGVPILGRWAESLRQVTQGSLTGVLQHLRDYEVLGVTLSDLDRVVYEEPSMLARESFHRAFGVSPAEQLRLEEAPRVPRVSLTPTHPVEFSADFLEPELLGHSWFVG